MKLVDLPKGFIPPKDFVPPGSKKKVRTWFIGILAFSIVGYVIMTANKKEALKEIIRKAPHIVSSIESLPPQEQERFEEVRGRAEAIYGKYLSPNEYKQLEAIALKATNGTATIDDLDLIASYWKKVQSLASAEEKEALSEWSRIAKNMPSLQ